MRAAFLVTLAGCAAWPTSSAAQHVSFFPARPPGAAISTYVGIIEHFGYGTGRGDLTIRNRRGRALSFALGYPYRIDGRTIACHQAPRRDYRPSHALCPDWPASIVLGRSLVRVSSWSVDDGGTRERASDALQTI